jgi:glyoxylase-like metal-dependent hydrolase (beta-lactamase superfamily II)
VKLLQRVIGPIATNLYVLGDEASGEAIAIDTATPCVEWLTATLAERGWSLKIIVSTHWHWDHIGDNAAAQEATGAQIAAHTLDRALIEAPPPNAAPFPIPPSVPAIELAEGSKIRFGAIELDVLHTPGHTQGSVCLMSAADRLLFTGDTLFTGSWGRTDLPGGSDEQMVDSLARLATLADDLRALPGHGGPTTIGDEKPWLEQVARSRMLRF